MVERKPGGTGGGPFVPSEAWIEAFEHQVATPTFFDAMWRYAERRARMLAHVKKVHEGYAAELVQDVLDDTLEGRIAWDPLRVTLAKHVMDAVKSRSRHHYRQACRRRHHSLDSGGEAMLDEVAASERENEAERAERTRGTAAILGLIRDRAGEDVEVGLLLDAYEHGAHTRSEVLAVVALTKLQYDAARKRLDRLIEELPNQLVKSARTA